MKTRSAQVGCSAVLLLVCGAVTFLCGLVYFGTFLPSKEAGWVFGACIIATFAALLVSIFTTMQTSADED